MADSGIFIGWGAPVRGRENKALAVFAESLAYYTRLQQEGTIESFEPVILSPHGGDLAGFILIRGEEAKLSNLMNDPEWLRLQTRASLIADNLGTIRASIGASMQQGLATFGAAIAELA